MPPLPLGAPLGSHPVTLAIDVPDGHRLTGEVTRVDGNARIPPPERRLECLGSVSIVIESSLGRRSKCSIIGWVEDEHGHSRDPHWPQHRL
jgi:hypothetical protein